MAALVGALDNLTPSQIGENCHLEYGWSNKIQEKGKFGPFSELSLP